MRTTLMLVCASMLLMGCAEPVDPAVEAKAAAARQRAAERAAAAEARLVEQIAATADELVEIDFYTAKLKFQKEEAFSLNVENSFKAKYQTIPISRATYDAWHKGKRLSEKSAGFLSGESYVVDVDEKNVEQRFACVTKGIMREIPHPVYVKALLRAGALGRRPTQVALSNGTRTALLDKPIGEYEIAEKKPLLRYYVSIHVQNETATLDFFKHWKNARTAHDFDLEVPREMYEEGGTREAEGTLMGSLLSKHWSDLNVTVDKRWTEPDPHNVQVRLADGREFVLPASVLQ